MIEALTAINELKTEARALDAFIIRGRVAPVQKNIQQIEGHYRSDNYVRRLAGLSPDTYRKSRTENAVEWFGATAIESTEHALRMRAFWEMVFDSTPIREPYILPDFWTLDEQCDVLLAKVRRCHVTGDAHEERLLLMHLRGQVDLMLRLVNTQAT